MKIKLLFLFTIIKTLCIGQSVKDNLIGDWVEVRREQRAGFVYTIGGALNEPSLELGFRKDSTASFYNPRTPDPKSFPKYFNLGDTLLALVDNGYLTVFDIIKSNKTDLVIVWRINKSYRDNDLDLKHYFIRKDTFNKLTQAQKDKLKAPTTKDTEYLNKILARKKKRD